MDMDTERVSIVRCRNLPESVAEHTVYRLVPKKCGVAFYRERTDRNIGWITREEQEFLRGCVVGVAGCGGMGGLIAATFLRLGVGEIRIADCEVFDVSNINRQFAARQETIGVAKAPETAKMLRAIAPDGTLVVYPQGISEGTARIFVEGCSLIFDEIEFFAVGARVLLHQEARRAGVMVLNCNTVGHATFCFKFTPESMAVEEALGLTYEEASGLERIVRTDPQGLAGIHAAAEIQRKIIRVFVPTVPEYAVEHESYRTRDAFLERLHLENRVSIIATNPIMASGFAANRGLIELLNTCGLIKRQVCELPPMPGYAYFDALRMACSVHSQKWW